jgi:hypothetical protein
MILIGETRRTQGKPVPVPQCAQCARKNSGEKPGYRSDRLVTNGLSRNMALQFRALVFNDVTQRLLK